MTMTTRKERLLAAYGAYNHRDADTLLALVNESVDWPDGAARLHGKDELRAYWTRQWAVTRTHDEPLEIAELAEGQSAVRVSQVVRALDGGVLSEGLFDHWYQFEGGLILRLNIWSVAAGQPFFPFPHATPHPA